MSIARADEPQSGDERPSGDRRHRRNTPEHSKPSAKTKKLTVTVPSDVLAAAARQVASGQAPSMSAYVTKALARQVATDEGEDSYQAFLDELDREFGPPSEEDFEWARTIIYR